MSDVVYNELIKLCDVFIDIALYKLRDIDIYDIWKDNYDDDIKTSVLVQLRTIASIKDRIKKLHNINIVLGGTENENDNS